MADNKKHHLGGYQVQRTTYSKSTLIFGEKKGGQMSEPT